jgi:hypothetical protein
MFLSSVAGSPSAPLSGSSFHLTETAVPRDDLRPGIDKPYRWQYPVGVVMILLMAAIAWWLHTR